MNNESAADPRRAEKYDLHCHSTASDGALSPSQLVERAAMQGVTALSLTDHDTVNGLTEASVAAAKADIRLIPGIEISTTWENKCFHIVGLNIDPDNPALNAGIKELQTIRSSRARRIAEKLAAKKVSGAYEAIVENAGSNMITRFHFADFLLQQKIVTTHQQAFDKYLAKGKPAYVSTSWATMNDAVDWIKQSGGVAVLAHPLRYKLSGSWLKRTLSAFKEAGGVGIEVITGQSSRDDIIRSAHLARRFDLYASVGSDFHTPSNQWLELGRFPDLPNHCQPIWTLL